MRLRPLSRPSLSATLCAALACAVPSVSMGGDALEEMIVTAVRMDKPLRLVTDPLKPRQPLPASDGAGYLKSIPGFSVIRKGGSDGDPVLRGMAGSRLSMLLDGDVILGGCSNRMDPPTAYIFPETLDVIEVIKGPQSVRYGPGNSAGVVVFERDNQRPEEAGWSGHASLLSASAERLDGMLDARYTNRDFTLRTTGSSTSAENYEDGDGTEVHSRYERWTAQVDFAWTPDDDTRLEMGAGFSDGEAAYADRGVDGSLFQREAYSASFEKRNLGSLLDSIEVAAYHNYVDHVMDNYSLREPAAMMASRMAMNPDRETRGGRLVVGLTPAATVDVTLGGDLQRNDHSNRSSMNQDMVDYRDLAREPDARFEQAGLFTEVNWRATEASRWLAGARVDQWEVSDLRSEVALSMMSSVPNPTSGESRDQSLYSGFMRFERDFDSPGTYATTAYAGIGHSERFPDYWEMIAKETTDSVSALGIDPEKTTQLDVGLLYNADRFSAGLSLFYNEIDDFLLIESGFEKPAVMGAMPMNAMATNSMAATRETTVVRNIAARSWGLEWDMAYRLTERLRLEGSLAAVRGANDSDGETLPQLPPLEMRMGLTYERSNWSAGMLWRAIAAQDRVDPGRGNIVGQDFGPTDSADVLSLNVGWQPAASLLVTAGVDNLLDATYAEHISRAGATVQGFDQLARINEPGRTFWLKASYSF
ncbi:TonB-dependent copper receptor [Parahaliea maris]|uniref:TonB-dependent copper receptor n=1 Tax=Parahaliea maris TaxID=2716870 RepID=A0A5C9A5M9_9GAMM|nr:TonB-dependent copper receptor [Parahaliea maris]TXS95302.1 TonB-dependent copper receptor [Parahaliea maris]